MLKEYPKYIIQILTRIITHHEDHEQYVGDVEELYQIHKKRKGAFGAQLYLIKQIFRSVPYFIHSSVYWGVAMLRNYLKIAVRNLYKYKLNSAINIFGMAIALSVCLLILLFVQDELSYDQYHENKDRVYRLINGESLWNSPNEAKLFKSNFPEIEESVRIFPRDGIQVQYEEKKFIENKITFADEAFFKLFTFEFVAGDKETALSKPRSVVLTEETASKYFENENPIGKNLKLDKLDKEVNYTVTGVIKKMPHNTHIHYDIIVSIVDDIGLWGEEWATMWGWRNFPTYIMLKENTEPSLLGEKFTELVINSHALKPEDEKPDYSLLNVADIHLYPVDKYNPLESQSDITYVIVFSSIALFILLIACFNYINILTANATTRLKEVGIKKVIGATRNQLARQFFLEAVVQFFIAFVCAMILIYFFLPAFNVFTSKELLFNGIFSSENMIIILGIVSVTLLIAGGYPARVISSLQPAVLMKGIKAQRNVSFNLRKVLVVLQYTISITLIISAGVMLRQIDFLYTTDLGYDKDQIVICEYEDDDQNPKYNSIKEALLQNSNISLVSAGSRLPSSDLGNKTFLKTEGAEKGIVMGIVHTDFDYFETFGIEPLQGRLFSKEMKTDRGGGLILNEAAVKALGLKDPVGSIVFEAWGNANIPVIGVVPDFHFESLYTEIAPIAFVVEPYFCRRLVAKIRPENVTATLDFIKETWATFYPEKVFQYKFLDENYAVQYEADQRTFQLMSYFTILTVFIASLGLFGMITHSAKSRVKEIGIRKTLGASVPSIIRILTSEYLLWIAFAFVLAAPVAFYMLNAWLQNFAYRIDMTVLDFISAAAIIILISFLTVIWQGLKASTANPIESLKYE